MIFNKNCLLLEFRSAGMCLSVYGYVSRANHVSRLVINRYDFVKIKLANPA